ncbi:MAG: mandelate racemase/muconate lactonizing enzyme family protein [Fimbriimonadaceae bacterium]
MKIDRVRLFPYSIGREKPFKIATMTSHSIDGVFVAIDAGGLTGWGEALPFHSINGETQGTCVESSKFLGQILIGREFGEVGVLVREMKGLLPAQTTAIGALDVALHDLVGQKLGVPIYQLFGGVNREMPTDLTIGIVDAREAEERAREIVRDGFGVIKVKLGDGVENDSARVGAVRAGAPDAGIRVDANQAYDRETALEVLDEISEFGVQFCEQPVKRGDWDGLKWLHDNGSVSVMADESCFSAEDAFGLISKGCCSLVNVKLCKSGGLIGGREIGTVVRNGFGNCMIGGMAETRLGVTASAHLGCSDDVFQYFDLDAHVGHTVDPIDGGIEIVDGRVRLSDEPGLGARPKDDFLAGLDMVEIL